MAGEAGCQAGPKHCSTINVCAPLFLKVSFLEMLAVARSAWQSKVPFSSSNGVGSNSTTFTFLDPQTLNVMEYPFCTKVHACTLVVEFFSKPAVIHSNCEKKARS
jgi:hypothetical protein